MSGRLAIRASAFGLRDSDLPAIREAVVRRLSAVAVDCEHSGPTLTVRYDPGLVAPAEIVGAIADCDVRRLARPPQPEPFGDRPSRLRRRHTLPRRVLPLSFSVARVVAKVLLLGHGR